MSVSAVHCDPIASTHHALRQRTAAAHARIDAIVGDGLPDSDAYRAYLRGMHRFIATSEQALCASTCDLSQARARLEADLAALGAVALAPARVAPELDQAAQLGWEYVVSGASVGARYLLRSAQALGYSAERGARFLAGHSAAPVWPDFLARLQQANLHGPALERACAAALSAFSTAEAAFRAATQEPVDD